MRPITAPARLASRVILAVGVALCASTAALQGQTWEPEPVDDIDAPSANARAVTADSVGNIFVSGSITDATGRQHAVVMKSSDGGATWATSADVPSVNDLYASNGTVASFTAIASAHVANGEDHLVAAGRIKRVPAPPSAPYTHLTGQWLIIRSKNAGTNWETVDEYTHPTYKQRSGNTVPGGVAVDSSGNIYVAGAAEETVVTVKGKTTTTTTVNHWLIRKGVEIAGAIVWTTVGDFPYPASDIGNYWESFTFPASAISCVGNNVFVVGGGGGSWHVRKSSDGGTTWPTVDTFRFNSNDNSHAFGVAADSAGTLYVAGLGGRISQNTSKPYWIVRRGTGGGTSWTTVDQFQYPNGSAQAYGVTVDGSGTVHVTGTGWSGSSPSLRHWVTRQRSAVTGAWSTTDDFSLASTGYSQGLAITTDPFGNLFAAGGGNQSPANASSDSAGVKYGWVVRRKLAP